MSGSNEFFIKYVLTQAETQHYYIFYILKVSWMFLFLFTESCKKEWNNKSTDVLAFKFIYASSLIYKPNLFAIKGNARRKNLKVKTKNNFKYDCRYIDDEVTVSLLNY